MSAGYSAGPGTTDVAKDEASNVAQNAGGAAGQVAGTAQEQAREVVSEAKAQVSDLGRQFKSQVDEQATTQRDRLTETLRSLSDELDQMANNGGQSGLATDAARQLADRGRRAAGFLEDKQPGDLVHQATDFARRRPGAFLLGAAAAGLLAGRLTRGAAASNSEGMAAPYPATTDFGVPPGGGVPAAGAPAYPEYEAVPPASAGYGADPYGTPEPYGTSQPYGTPDPYGPPVTDQSYPPPVYPQRTDGGQDDAQGGYRP